MPYANCIERRSAGDQALRYGRRSIPVRSGERMHEVSSPASLEAIWFRKHLQVPIYSCSSSAEVSMSLR